MLDVRSPQFAQRRRLHRVGRLAGLRVLPADASVGAAEVADLPVEGSVAAPDPLGPAAQLRLGDAVETAQVRSNGGDAESSGAVRSQAVLGGQVGTVLDVGEALPPEMQVLKIDFAAGERPESVGDLCRLWLKQAANVARPHRSGTA